MHLYHLCKTSNNGTDNFIKIAPVAQSDRVPASEAGSCGFNPRQVHQIMLNRPKRSRRAEYAIFYLLEVGKCWA